MTAASENRTGDARPSFQAVLFLDLANSSRLMSERQQETIEFLDRCAALFRNCCEKHNGELVKETGDGALLVFATAASAILFALEVQREIPARAGRLGPLAAFRAGIHAGDILRRHGDVFGNVVNVASRLEKLAEPGGICISHEAFELAHKQIDVGFEALGRKRLRNIPGVIGAYRVVPNAPALSVPFQTNLSINTIGGMSLSRDGDTVPVPRGTKARGIVAFLAVSPDGSELRGSLATALWPGRRAVEAERLIDRTIKRLVDHIPIEIRDSRVRLDPDRVSVDLQRIERDLLRGKVDPLLNRIADWPDQILYGYEKIGAVFASTLAVIRSDWRTRNCDLLERCLDRFDSADDGMRDAATALIRLEPAHERAARALIRHYHVVDNREAAVRVFDELRDCLAKKFGLEPKPETVAAVRGEAKSRFQPITTTHKPIRIQIGEFRSDRPETGLAADLRNQLIASLAAFRGWSVVEVEQPTGDGSAFGDYRLTGSHRAAQGDIGLLLIEPASRRPVWTETLPLASGSFQATKQSVIGRIAATLEVYIATDRVSVTHRDISSAAVDSWLRGERLFSRWTPTDHDQAADIFAGLIDREPEFAPAYASLASLFNVRHIVRPGVPRDAIASHKAYLFADRAAELDPLDARNQLAIAWSASLEGDFDKASLHMRMAARLNPNSPRTIVSCAMGLAFFGEHEHAGELLAHSLRCAPLMLDYQWCYAASVYFLAGDYEAALTAARRGRDRIIDNPGWHAATLVKLGRPDEAAAQFHSLVESVRANWHRNEPASPKAVRDWFIDIYPLRRETDRRSLSEALAQIVA